MNSTILKISILQEELKSNSSTSSMLWKEVEASFSNSDLIE